MICGLARFKELGIELSDTVVAVDNLPKTSRVKEKLHELIETKYSGIRREPRSLNVCEFDQMHVLAWVEFMDINGENSTMRPFVREMNYECFLGNILTVSVVKDMKVIEGYLKRAVTYHDHPSECETVRYRTPVILSIRPPGLSSEKIILAHHVPSCCVKYCQAWYPLVVFWVASRSVT